MLQSKDFLALFRKVLHAGRLSFAAFLQSLKFGNRLVELPIDHCFISQQLVEILFLGQVEMIRHGIHFRITRRYKPRFGWIAFS